MKIAPLRTARSLLVLAVGLIALALVAALAVARASSGPAASERVAQTQQNPETVLDHFKCYRIEAPPFEPRTVHLRDQFESKETNVALPIRLCNPVSKNGSPILHREAHLTCFRIEDLPGQPPFAPREVDTRDQFGDQRLRLLRPAELCVPSLKSLEGPPQPGPVPVESLLDHFKCYVTDQTAAAPRQVFLSDQFGDAGGFVDEPVRVCNPVEKRHGGAVFEIKHESAHLKCYRLEAAPPQVPTANVRNQFGFGELRVLEPELLCNPALKDVPPPPPPALDHFKCYLVKGRHVREPVRLEDQFGLASASVLRGVLLCNPVEKRHDDRVTPIENPETHMKCYTIKSGAVETPRVRVRNQFGEQGLEVLHPRLLCAPASKTTTPGVAPGPPPTNIDHFKCYTVKGERLEKRVVLRDQFHVEETVVVDPALLCNPVKKTRTSGEVTPVEFPKRHLVCYTLRPRDVVRTDVVVRTQFGLERFDVERTFALCVPSEKTVVD